jgi:hypothetical protein
MAQDRSPEAQSSGGDGRESRRGLWIALVCLAAVPFLFYSSMVLRGWEPPAPDTSASRPYGIWGNAVVQATGHTPLWFPNIFSGMPSYGSFIFTPRSPFDPVADVKKLTGENRGAYYVLLFFMAGAGLFAYLRRQGFSRLASTTAALVCSMTPYLPGSAGAGHSTKIEALCLLPTLLLAIDCMLERADLLRCAFLAGVGAILAWSNHPQVAFYGLLIGALYAAGILLTERGRGLTRAGWVRLGVFVVVAIALAAGMAAEPYWAVKEYTPYSIRGGASADGGAAGASGATQGVGWDYATAWSFHPKELVSFLFPGWFGLQGVTYWGPMPFTQSTHYFGLLALGLALFGLWRGSGTRRWVWAAISVVVLLVGFGRYFPVLYGPLYYVVPLFNKFRVPSMIYGTLPLCLAYLVAGGFDQLLAALPRWSVQSVGSGAKRPTEGKGVTHSGRKRAPASPASGPRLLLLLLGLIVVFWLVVILVAKAGLSDPNALIRSQEAGRYEPSVLAGLHAERVSILLRSVSQGCALLALSLLVLWLGASGAWPRRALAPGLGVVIGLLVVGDVLLVSRRFYQVEPKPVARETIPAAGAASFISRQSGVFRVLPVGDLFQSNALSIDGVESVGGYHPAKLRLYQDLLDENRLMSPGILKMLNVRYILSGKPLKMGAPPLFSSDGYVYSYPDSLPRAWAVTEVRQISDRAAMLRELSGNAFDPGHVAYLYANGPQPSGSGFAPAAVTIRSREPGRLSLRVEAQAASFVVISEIAYAPGWQATMDGGRASLYRVNHVLQGVEVPAGIHEVNLRVVSPNRQIGVRVSRTAGGLTLLLAVLGFALNRRRLQGNAAK